MDVPLSAVIAIVGVGVSIVGALIILNLKSIKECLRKLTGRIDKQDDRIEGMGNRLAACKVDCHREFVSGELFLRETGFQRRALETLSASVNRLEGNLKVVERLPEISGEIARQVVREFKNGEKT